MFLGLAMLLAGTASVSAQVVEDLPALAKPLRPESPADLKRREACTLYGVGLIRLHQDRFVDATRLFEEALALDPDAVAIHRVLISLFVALGRTSDALAECKAALALAPEDYETWALYARHLKGQGQLKEACIALEKATKCNGIGENVELHLQVLNELGVLAQATSDYPQALKAFTQLVRMLNDPQTVASIEGVTADDIHEQAARTYERLIRVCTASRQFELAGSFFDEARKIYPQIVGRLALDMAKVELARDKPEAALALIDGPLHLQPSGTETYEVWIEALKKLQRKEEIVSGLERYSAQDSSNRSLRLLLAREYTRAGRKADAEKIYQVLAERSPTPEVYAGLFNLWRENGRAEDALDQLEAAIARAGKDSEQPGDAQSAAKARAMLDALRADSSLARAVLAAGRQRLQDGGNLHSQTHYYLAVLAAQAHELVEAETFYRRCLAGGRYDPQQEHAYYSGLIQVLWEAQKYAEVAEVCRQGLSQAHATNLVYFHRYLSQAFAMLDRPQEAATEADKGVEMADPRSRFGMRLNRLYVYDQVRRRQQGVAEAQAMLKEYTESSQVRDIRLRLGNLYSGLREYPKAEEQLRLILQADPNDSTANNDLGYLLADLAKNLDEAEKMIRKAIALDEEQRASSKEVGFDLERGNSSYLDSLGWVLFRRGKLADARSWLEKAAGLYDGEKDPTIWDHLGDVCFRLHDRQAARLSWQKAAVLYESTKSRMADEHYNELQRKLRILDAEAGHARP
jgi:tetratricopeptide (TPR) repeat protein